MADETLRRSQNSFSGGEIGSKVLGRVDLAKFNTGLRYAKNVFVEIEGAFSNRAGLEFGGHCLTDSGVIRYYPFEAPNDVTYVMEITPGAIRFYFDNQIVLDGLGDPFAVITPYTSDDIYGLVFAQSNDIMTITHQAHAPRELRRTAFNVFNLVTITTNPAVTAPSISIVDSDGAGAGEIEQAYKVSTIDGNGIEGLASAKITNENNLDVAGDHNTVGWNEVAGASAYIAYKRRAGQFGFIGFVRTEDNFGGVAPNRTYRVIDNQINPNVSQTPKEAVDPFPTSNDYPGICILYQQRRVFSASLAKPNSIISSQVGAFDGFRNSIPAVPDDSFEFALGAARTQRIRHIVSLDDLLIFTSTQEWRLNASNGFSASQPPDLKPQSSIGISDIPPIVVGTDIMYVPGSKRTVYRMNYSFDFNKFMSDDIGVLSKHLFKKRRLRGWCYAQEPHFLLFGFFDDGQGVFLAYNREQQVYGWTRFETDGFVEAATVIRENGIDRLYLAVRRRVGGVYQRFFERLAERDIDNVADGFFVDSGVRESDFIAVDRIEGGVIYTTTPHGFADGSEIRLYDVLGIMPDDEAFDINTRYKAAVVNATELTLLDYTTEDPVDIDEYIYNSGGKLRSMRNFIAGLDHLNGRTVNALADGFVVEGLVVSGGQVSLPFTAGIRIAGIPYESEAHTLELEREDEPTRGRQKSVAHLVMRVLETRGIKIGTKTSNLRELKERDYEPTEDPVNPGSEIVREQMPDGWEDEIKIIIKQDKPLPMTILSVIPEYTFGV